MEIENKGMELHVKVTADDVDQAVKDALEKKLAAAEKKAKKAGEEAAELKAKADKAKDEAKQEAKADMDQLRGEKTELEKAKNDAEARAKELEKRLKLADSTAAVFQVYFQSAQEDLNRMLGIIKKAEPETGGKLKKALNALLDSVKGANA